MASPAHAKAIPGSGSQVKELKYWNGRGLMDPPRMMMVMAGKGFEDKRIGDGEGLTPHASIGDLSANLGRVPLAVTSSGNIGQSTAINFFVASECDMMGSSKFEAACILAFCEHIKEMVASYFSLVPWGTEPKEGALDTFFDSFEASDVSGTADMKTRSQRYLRWYLGRLEVMVPGDGYCVGGRLSLADVALFNALANNLGPDDHLAGLGAPAFKRETFASAVRTKEALKAHPKLAAIVANVEAHPKLQAWLATRGKQGF